jgi:hypothetical protein
VLLTCKWRSIQERMHLQCALQGTATARCASRTAAWAAGSNLSCYILPAMPLAMLCHARGVS